VADVRYVRISLSLSRTRKRRRFEQRLAASAPSLAHRSVAAVRRLLPLTSRIRQRLTARATKLAYEAWNRRDWEVVLATYAPDVEIVLNHDLTGMEGMHQGHDGWRRYWELWAESWEESSIEPQELIDFSDRMLVLSRIRSRARASRIELNEPLAHLMTFERGAVVRHEEWFGHADALAAVGLASRSVP
jgi:ketosteroid isomerase-like protein